MKRSLDVLVVEFRLRTTRLLQVGDHVIRKEEAGRRRSLSRRARWRVAVKVCGEKIAFEDGVRGVYVTVSRGASELLIKVALRSGTGSR